MAADEVRAVVATPICQGREKGTGTFSLNRRPGILCVVGETPSRTQESRAGIWEHAFHDIAGAAYQTLLRRYTGQNDIVVGSPVAGRNRKETEGLVGFFLNMLVLRTDHSANPTFRQVLQYDIF